MSAEAHDACAPLAIRVTAATEAEQAGIADAIDLWRGRGIPAIAMDAPPGSGAAIGAAADAMIELRFEPAAATFHGVYDPDAAAVLINRDLTGDADRAALAIVIAHELGHVFGLVHIDPGARLSLMNPGNLTMPPTDADQQAIEAMWGSCAASR